MKQFLICVNFIPQKLAYYRRNSISGKS